MNSQLKAILKSKKVFLFDLDGTLYLGKKLIPGAREFLEELRMMGKQIFFFTNNSSRSLDDYVRKLQKFGFEVEAEEIVMSTHTLISFLKKRKWRKIFLLGTPAMKKMLKKEKIQQEMRKPQAVVVGFDKTLAYANLLKACRWIAGGVPFVVTHPDLYCPTDEGPEPDCGAIAKLLELSSGKTPMITLGKPHPSMIEEVLRRSGRKKSEMVLIGDRLSTDIAMGNAAGISTILVLSGETKQKDLSALRSKKPNAVVPSVNALRMLG